MILSLFAAALIQFAPATEAFEAVCAKLEQEYIATCEDLSPPKIIYTKLMQHIDVRGMWMHGEEIFFIDPSLPPEINYEVILHETVHYVLWMLDHIREHCRSEEYARVWTAEILNKTIDLTWRIRYDCPLIEEKQDA